MERSKMENTVLGMIECIRKSVRENDGKLTIGETNSLLMLKELCTRCLEIGDVRESLDELMDFTTGEES